MRAIRSINNNIAVCVDSAGTELIAMGKGIGYGKLPREIDLDDVTHTYYKVDERQLAGITDIPQEVLTFAAVEADRIRDQLPYQLSPNFAFTLADHIAFAIDRARRNLQVRMPLAFDIEQNYSTESRIGRQLVRRMRRTFKVALREDEAAGIAMSIVNAQVTAPSEDQVERQLSDEDLLEDITEMVENHFDITVDRTSFAFSRYATHIYYLFDRLREGDLFVLEGIEGLQGVEEQLPEEVECVKKITARLEETWGTSLTDEERLFLVLHVGRIRIKGGSA